MKIITQLLISLIAYSAISANAALYDRGNGMIYDSGLNITWLQDANYAQTSGYDADGYMDWYESSTWADNLAYGGFSDWRLSSTRSIGNFELSYDGSTDLGYNSTRSEIGHLFFELGNKAAYDTSGGDQAGYGFWNTMFTDPTTNQNVSFINIKNNYYWQSGTTTLGADIAGLYITYYGNQTYGRKDASPFYAWAVRDGDVSAVPVPAAMWLFGTALLGLVGVKRHSR